MIQVLKKSVGNTGKMSGNCIAQPTIYFRAEHLLKNTEEVLNKHVLITALGMKSYKQNF